jgi:hypothetical protein
MFHSAALAGSRKGLSYMRNVSHRHFMADSIVIIVAWQEKTALENPPRIID